MEFVKKHVGTYAPHLAGNSVYVDLSFLKVTFYHVIYFFNSVEYERLIVCTLNLR